jgi:hypothetical protein
MPQNPFAPLPTGSSALNNPGEVYRDGKFVVTPVVATWPARCVTCNRAVPDPSFHAKVTPDRPHPLLREAPHG